jgi:serine/threonine protein kinase
MAFSTSAGHVAVVSAVERLLDGSTTNLTAAAPHGDQDLSKGAQRMRVTLVFILAGFATIWLLCVGLIWHMRVNRAGALRGDAAAARKVILPAFEPVLTVLSVINGAYIVFLLVALATGFFDAFVSPIVLEMFYSGNQFMFVLVLVLMFQKSLSFPAIKRSVGISMILSYYTVLYVWAVTKLGRQDQQKSFTIALQFVRGLLMLPFLYAVVKPPSRATKRIIRELCFVTIVYFLLTVLLMILILNPKTASSSQSVVYIMLTWVAFCPLVVWRVLKADTEYWRGIGQRACALQDFFQRENGLSERVSSEGLHVLIEMNRKCVIDFAYLELVRQLGVGSTSTVFQGTLKAKTHVAVKVYAPTSCSEDVVAAFSHEAAMCRVLDHPNIVKFHGMCVAPPTICLVFQLCQGSLAATLEDQARRQSAHPARQQLLISVGYMLDAARAVAYLHSFSPPFVHRDIKSENFLVDAECSVQLSDFGESRCLTMLEQKTLALRPKVAVLEEKACVLNNPVDSPTGTTMSLVDSPCLANISADYAAPEVIEGKGEQICYGEAADVYSLAVTMWDILHPSADKFPQASGDNAQVMEVVLHGVRPRMDTNTPPRLRGIIERAWQREPGLRPSAEQIVAALEDVQEELCARLVLELLGDLGEGLSGARSSSARSAGPHHTSPFPGAFLVDRMIDRRFVRSPAEAIRMGNALMDSSVLHHVNHSRSFENSATAQYYFDLDEVQLSLPTHGERSMARDSSAASQNESSIPMLTRGSNGGDVRTSFSFVRTRNDGLCHCRQLGQRLGTVKTSRFHSRRRFKAAPEPTAESNLLTAALLVEEGSSHEDNYHSLNIVSGTAASMA